MAQNLISVQTKLLTAAWFWLIHHWCFKLLWVGKNMTRYGIFISSLLKSAVYPMKYALSFVRLWSVVVRSSVFCGFMWYIYSCSSGLLNTLRPRQNGRHFADDTFKYIFLNENVIIAARISLKFVPKGPINNIPALVQIMAWRRPGDKPLFEPMMVSLPTHICVTRPS